MEKVVMNFKFKYEIYLPDRYLADNKSEVKIFSSLELCNKITDLVNKLLTDYKVTGVSIRKEDGYYKDERGSVNVMKNQVLYFYSGNKINLNDLVFDLCKSWKQESIMYTVNGEAYIVYINGEV